MGRGVFPGKVGNHLCRDSCFLLRPGRRTGAEGIPKGLIPFCPMGKKIPVRQVFFLHHMHHGQGQSSVGARTNQYGLVTVGSHVCCAGFYEHHPFSLSAGLDQRRHGLKPGSLHIAPPYQIKIAVQKLPWVQAAGLAHNSLIACALGRRT